MSCCTNLKEPKGIGRRSFLKGMAGVAAGLALGQGGLSLAQGNRIRLAFCSQLLCVVPYEFTRAQGFFDDEGLDVELVYSRGGGAAMQALVGGAVEYAATSFDVALSAFAQGAPIKRFATTGRLPLFALATSPQHADAISDIGDLSGLTLGVSALGNADHVLALYLLNQAGVDPEEVRFATLGTNLFDALRVAQVEVGMVQEPALTLLLEQGGRVLFNGMDLADATRYLGGAYEFMGVAVREAEREQRLDEMQRLARALERGLLALREAEPMELVDALPSELVVGGDRDRLAATLDQYRLSLYPESVAIEPESSQRVLDANVAAGVLEDPVDLNELLDLEALDAEVTTRSPEVVL